MAHWTPRVGSRPASAWTNEAKTPAPPLRWFIFPPADLGLRSRLATSLLTIKSPAGIADRFIFHLRIINSANS